MVLFYWVILSPSAHLPLPHTPLPRPLLPTLNPQPFGEDGSGYYSEATKGCYDVIANAKELVTHAVDRTLAARAAAGTQGSLFTVADFGTADAGTSMVSTCSCVVWQGLSDRSPRSRTPPPVSAAVMTDRVAPYPQPLMVSVVQQVRAAEGASTPIMVAYEDQTNNDWNSVFKRVHGVLPGADQSYLDDASDTNVFMWLVNKL